jgi:hypothetical protein
MENYSDSDTSSESEYDSGGGSAAVSDCDKDEPSQDLEPESSEYYDEYRNIPWNPDAQIQAQLDDAFGIKILVPGEVPSIGNSDIATKGLYIFWVVDRGIVALVVASETMLGRDKVWGKESRQAHASCAIVDKEGIVPISDRFLTSCLTIPGISSLQLRRIVIGLEWN